MDPGPKKVLTHGGIIDLPWARVDGITKDWILWESRSHDTCKDWSAVKAHSNFDKTFWDVIVIDKRLFGDLDSWGQWCKVAQSDVINIMWVSRNLVYLHVGNASSKKNTGIDALTINREESNPFYMVVLARLKQIRDAHPTISDYFQLLNPVVVR